MVQILCCCWKGNLNDRKQQEDRRTWIDKLQQWTQKNKYHVDGLAENRKTCIEKGDIPTFFSLAYTNFQQNRSVYGRVRPSDDLTNSSHLFSGEFYWHFLPKWDRTSPNCAGHAIISGLELIC